jgi:hypothetical protein
MCPKQAESFAPDEGKKVAELVEWACIAQTA